MSKTLKYLSLMLISIISVACGGDEKSNPTDSSYNSLIVGKWQMDNSESSDIWTFTKEGYFKTEYIDEDGERIVGAGSWHITGNELYYSITFSEDETENNHDIIAELTTSKMTLISDETLTFTRIE